jgi:hypothetical protein
LAVPRELFSVHALFATLRGGFSFLDKYQLWKASRVYGTRRFQVILAIELSCACCRAARDFRFVAKAQLSAWCEPMRSDLARIFVLGPFARLWISPTRVHVVEEGFWLGGLCSRTQPGRDLDADMNARSVGPGSAGPPAGTRGFRPLDSIPKQ